MAWQFYNSGGQAVAGVTDADTVDGSHASAFATASHSHVEADVTDLDHDAAKLQGRALASSAPADGQAVVWNDTAGQWEPQTVSAGSSYPPAWKPEPDEPPASAHARDDEFDDGSFDVKWTETTNGSGTHSKTEADDRLTVTMPTSDLDVALTQAAPTGDFTVTARLGADRMHKQYQSVGLAVWDGAVGSSNLFRVCMTAHNSMLEIGFQRYSGWGWGGNYLTVQTVFPQSLYARFRYDSTGNYLYFGISGDGVAWREYRLSGVTSLSNIGLYITCDGTPDYQWEGHAYWFRVVESV